MKIAILLGDGMAGEPLPEHGGRTTLEIAATPNMDRLARAGVLGTATTVPKGYPPGSDVANLSVFGYDPAECYTGRAPLEAAAMGVKLGPGDVAYRMNLVSLLVGSSEVYMEDFSAGHISTAEAKQLVEYIGREMAQEGFEYYPGVSYRHLLVWRNGEDRAKTTPPHDITEQPIHRHLPTGPGSDTLLGLITGSQILLKDHPVNRARQEAGKLEANSIWLWGQGRAPRMETYAQKFGIGGGTVVSAVDLLKGIGKMAGLECPEIAGATGYIDTNYEAKVAAALDALKRSDFVFVHLEAPDESGHQGNFEHKVKAIEDFDARVVGPVWQALETSGEEFQLLVMPDHPTPLARRTHTSEAVPFALLESRAPGKKPGGAYTEKAARATGLHVEKAHRLMAHMTGRDRLW